MKIVALIFSLIFVLSCQKEQAVVIGHQLTPNPWKYLIASGKLSNLAGKKVLFKKFNSGSKVMTAMASGKIDIAVAGSTPIAAGLSQGLPIKLVSMMHVIGESEALVVRNEINKLENLKGKKIGVPFGSTSHFHLMLALKSVGLKTNEVTVLNLSPPAILASWQRGEIDGAYVWTPALVDILKTGKMILSSKDLAEKGDPTFDGIIVRDKFLAENKPLVSQLVNEIQTLHQEYNKNPWKEDSEQIKLLSDFAGSPPKDIIKALAGNTFPSSVDLSTLGEILKTTSEFLKSQGKIEKVLDDYNSKIATEI